MTGATRDKVGDTLSRRPFGCQDAGRELRAGAPPRAAGGQSMLRSSSVIGLDIGSHQIKAVYMERRRQAWQMVSAGAVATPPGAVQEGIVQQPDAVAERLRDLCRQNE